MSEPSRKRIRLAKGAQERQRWHSRLLQFLLANRATRALYEFLDPEDLVLLWNSAHPLQRQAILNFIRVRLEFVRPNFIAEEAALFQVATAPGRLVVMRLPNLLGLPPVPVWTEAMRVNGPSLHCLSITKEPSNLHIPDACLLGIRMARELEALTFEAPDLRSENKAEEARDFDTWWKGVKFPKLHTCSLVTEQAWNATEVEQWVGAHASRLTHVKLHVLPYKNMMPLFLECKGLTSLNLVWEVPSIQHPEAKYLDLDDATILFKQLGQLEHLVFGEDDGRLTWHWNRQANTASLDSHSHYRILLGEQQPIIYRVASMAAVLQVLPTVRQWTKIHMHSHATNIWEKEVKDVLESKQIESVSVLSLFWDTTQEDNTYKNPSEASFRRILDKWPRLLEFHMQNNDTEGEWEWHITRPNADAKTAWQYRGIANRTPIDEMSGKRELKRWPGAIDTIILDTGNYDDNVNEDMRKVVLHHPVQLRRLELGSTQHDDDSVRYNMPGFVQGVTSQQYKWNKNFLRELAIKHPTLETLRIGMSNPILADEFGVLKPLVHLQHLRVLQITMVYYPLLHADLEGFVNLTHLEVHIEHVDDDSLQYLNERGEAAQVGLPTLYTILRKNPALETLILRMNPDLETQSLGTEDVYYTALDSPNPTKAPGVHIPDEMKHLVTLHLSTRAATISRAEIRDIRKKCPAIRTIRFECGNKVVPWHRPCDPSKDGVFQYPDAIFGCAYDGRLIYGRDLSCFDLGGLASSASKSMETKLDAVARKDATMDPFPASAQGTASPKEISIVLGKFKTPSLPTSSVHRPFPKEWHEEREKVISDAILLQQVDMELPTSRRAPDMTTLLKQILANRKTGNPVNIPSTSIVQRWADPDPAWGRFGPHLSRVVCVWPRDAEVPKLLYAIQSNTDARLAAEIRDVVHALWQRVCWAISTFK